MPLAGRAGIAGIATIVALGVAVSLVLAGTAGPASPPGTANREQVERGRRIYRQGIGSGPEPIVAMLGTAESGAEVNRVAASVLPCAGCHGRDRRGRPEGGLNPSDLTWDSLTDPAGLATGAGRYRPSRPPYNERLLKRAITLGVDSAGQALQGAMPRFQLSQGDMADLLAYLQTRTDPEPGLADARLRLGIALPPAGALPETHRAIRQALSAYAESVNAGGGLYGRRIELQFAEVPARCTKLPALLKDLARNPGVFALVAPFAAGCEGELAAVAEPEEVPVVGPLALSPPAEPSSRLIFFLDSGLQEAVHPLALLAAHRFAGTPPHAAIVHPAESGSRGMALALREEATRVGWEPPLDVELPDPPPALRDLAARLRDSQVGLVFFLGPPAELPDLLAAAREAGWHPRLLAPGSPATPESAAAAAVTAARLFVEAARRAGRDLTREKLVAGLESLYRFETSGAPPVTFGSGRRIGIHGTPFRWIDTGSPGSGTEGGWIELD